MIQRTLSPLSFKNSAYFLVPTYVKVFVFCLCFVASIYVLVERRVAVESNESHANLTVYGYNGIFLNKVDLPYCSENLLDQREYDFRRWTRGGSNERHLVISSNGEACQLVRYTTERVVKCIDGLHYKNTDFEKSQEGKAINSLQKAKRLLHFAFVGDSRIRQHFLSVANLIPQYDWKIQPRNINSFLFQQDRNITSKILNLRLSYYWRPTINGTVFEMFKEWSSKQIDAPFLTVIGISVHHMLQANGNDLPLYTTKLIELAPILDQLARTNQVIWINQYPTYDIYGPNGFHGNDIYSEKIENYNKALRNVLRKYPGIRIWDSSNQLAEEYVRSCKLRDRQSHESTVLLYSKCKDYIHTGYVALFSATQLLMNSVCNSRVV